MRVLGPKTTGRSYQLPEVFSGEADDIFDLICIVAHLQLFVKMKIKWHALFKLCAVIFLVLEVGNFLTIFFLLGDFPNLIFWLGI